jgi:hypothetical protein
MLFLDILERYKGVTYYKWRSIDLESMKVEKKEQWIEMPNTKI